MPFEFARHAGYCAGVRRAVELARQAAKQALETGTACVMLGELIHNDQSLEEFRRLGVRVIDRLEDAPADAAVILRSHGEPPETYEKAEALGLRVVDTTCVFVASLHETVRKSAESGRPVLLLGDPAHPEIIGTAGFGKGMVYVLKDADAPLPELTAPVLVAQTTYPPAKWEEAVEKLSARYTGLTPIRTICTATQQRQQAAAELAARADAMVVVGGRKSANTRKLYDTCPALCPRTCLVESAGEIPEGFCDIRTELLGIAAGASTPDWSYKEVVTVMNETEQNNMEQAVPAEEAREELQETVQQTAAVQEDAALTEEEMNKRSFMDDIEATLVRIRPGQTVTGKVVQITEDEVCVNIGY